MVYMGARECGASIVTNENQTESYIYVMGIRPDRVIKLESNVLLEPDACNPSGSEIVEATINRGDHSELSLALAAASLRRSYAQLHVFAEDGKSLAATTWNSQWWCIALSAFTNSEIAFFFQSEMPLSKVFNSAYLHAIVSNMLPMPRDCRSISLSECDDIERFAPSLLSLMNNDKFSLAANSLWGSGFHPRPSIQLATVWVGIEALFPFRNNKRVHLTRAIPEYLQGEIGEDEIAALWDARNEAVHEGVLSHIDNLTKSKQLLAKIIKKSVLDGQLPSVQ